MDVDDEMDDEMGLIEYDVRKESKVDETEQTRGENDYCA